MERRRDRGIVRLSTMAAGAALVWSLGTGTAHALVVRVASATVTPADVRVVVQAMDGTGTVSLICDGVVIGQRPSGGEDVVFSQMPLVPGRHRLCATMRSAAGVTGSRPLVDTYAWGVPAAPRWVAPSGGYTVATVDVRVYAGASTSSMTLSVNGVLRRTVTCVPGQMVSFGTITVGKGVTTYRIDAGNPVGLRATFTATARRVEYPYATCIIVDKSDFRLYWIRGNQLVKAYPIAHGKGNCTPIAVWKVLAKYRTSPTGIYGPRKMRLFRRSGTPGHYLYSYTAYGIHGTNQPWVIGTMASHGCIRMYNSDVLELWPQVPLGTMVVTRQ